jgi:hypothetical protein
MNKEPLKTGKSKESDPLETAKGLSFIESLFVGPAKDKEIAQFANRLTDLLEPNLTALETVQRMVRAALEVEFGVAFTLSPGFGKMVKTIAQSMTTIPELRRQALAIATLYLENKKNRRPSS